MLDQSSDGISERQSGLGLHRAGRCVQRHCRVGEWRELPVPTGDRYAWNDKSTYVKHPPYFEGMTMTPPGVRPIAGARALGMFGDSITTDHISPAGNIAAASPAGA